MHLATRLGPAGFDVDAGPFLAGVMSAPFVNNDQHTVPSMVFALHERLAGHRH